MVGLAAARLRLRKTAALPLLLVKALKKLFDAVHALFDAVDALSDAIF
jgi:hypothetical protein